jgi:RNA polymerase sigma-70 factor, ECF subfamily
VHYDDSRPGVNPKNAQTAHPPVRPAGARIGSGGAPVLEAVAGNDLDRTLIAAIAAGDEAAFNEIHARYYRRVARFTRRITRCSELTAEITNDTLWAIWRCAPSFKGSSRVSTWIMGIAYHIGLKALHSSRRREAHEEPMRDFIEAAHEPWSDGNDREWVGAALVQLAEEQRTVLELFYRFGHSCEEIAEMVDCPANTVKTRMYHGRRKMRRLLPRLARFETG